MIDSSKKNNSFIIKRSDVIFVLMLFFTIVDSIGAFQAKTLSSESIRNALVTLKYIVLAFLVFTIFSKPVRIYMSIAVPILYYLSTHLHIYNFSAFNYDFLILGFLLMYFICDDETKERLYDAIYKYFVVISAIGIICYFSYSFHLGIPYKVNNYYFGDDIYINYYFCYLLTGYSKIVRLCGLFVEPGLFGTLIILILSSSGIKLNKLSTYILLFAGILTFSLAFVYTLVMYLMLNYFRNRKQIIVILLIVFLGFFVISNSSIFSLSYDNLLNRLFSDNSLSRTNAKMNVWFDEWLKSNKLLFGYGIGYYDFTGTLSYKQELLKFGIIGFIIEYGFLLYDCIKKSKGNISSLIYVFLFFINIYQRPEIYTLIYMVILYGGIIKLTKREVE